MIALGGIFLFILGVLVGLALGVVADMKRAQWKRVADASRAARRSNGGVPDEQTRKVRT